MLIYRGKKYLQGQACKANRAPSSTTMPYAGREGCEKGRRKGQVIVLGDCGIWGPSSGIVVLGPTFGDCEFSVFNVLLRGQAMLKPACPGCLLPLGLLAL